MIQQRVGDLLEIDYEKTFSYVVVLTKIVMFGGNIVFAYHTDGKKQKVDFLIGHDAGFNVCTDLLLPKRDGQVARLHRFEVRRRFWRTKFVKGAHEHRPGVKAKEWFIYKIDNLSEEHIARVTKLTPEYKMAMDNGCYSFDLVAELIKRQYTPDQNVHI